MIARKPKSKKKLNPPPVPKITFSYDDFKDHTDSQGVRDLETKLDKALDKVDSIKKKIEEAYKKCGHIYLLWAKGMYDDTYRCRKCGHFSEK